MEDKKAEIFRCGKELFSSKGFKDTNISDITKMCGIAVGTFYNYYASKEKLFIEIYLRENEELKRSMMAKVDVDDAGATTTIHSNSTHQWNGLSKLCKAGSAESLWDS